MFTWLCVKAHFPLENPFIDLIYTNHYLIHLQKCQHCGLSTSSNIIRRKIFITSLSFLTHSQFFVDALLKSNSPYFLLKKNKDFS